MTEARLEKLGIKQTIQKAWMDRVVQMMLAGIPEKEIRTDLNEFLATQLQSGGIGKRGRNTYQMAIGTLSSWFSPDADLVAFRDDVLKLARKSTPDQWLPLHWATLSASYPFWFNVAKQTGRLLNLQEQIKQAQVVSRLKEQYGDRETVARNARYTVRSFVAWGVLEETGTRGCYEKSVPVNVENSDVAVRMIESALYAMPEAAGVVGALLNNPAFFPFRLPAVTGDFVSKHSSRIDVFKYDLNDDLLKLREMVNIGGVRPS